jgi:hypothetical protein
MCEADHGANDSKSVVEKPLRRLNSSTDSRWQRILQHCRSSVGLYAAKIGFLPLLSSCMHVYRKRVTRFVVNLM